MFTSKIQQIFLFGKKKRKDSPKLNTTWQSQETFYSWSKQCIFQGGAVFVVRGSIKLKDG